MPEALKLDNICKSFGNKTVLRNLSFSVEKGTVSGLLGINGSGKTTLMRILMGIIPTASGKIMFDGRPVKPRDHAYKAAVGYIPEDAFFYPGMTIDQFMRLNSSFYSAWNPEKEKKYLRFFDLEERLRIGDLSRGMKLKLGLSAALAQEPDILLMDDPTSGLDVPTRHDFLKEIIRELSEKGITILFASHMVHELENIVDRVLILHEGRIMLDETLEKLKSGFRKLITDKEDTEINIKNENIIRKKQSMGKIEWAVFPWNEIMDEEIHKIPSSGSVISSMTLEEIFSCFVSQKSKRGE